MNSHNAPDNFRKLYEQVPPTPDVHWVIGYTYRAAREEARRIGLERDRALALESIDRLRGARRGDRVRLIGEPKFTRREGQARRHLMWLVGVGELELVP